jgi:hypothetical protein
MPAKIRALAAAVVLAVSLGLGGCLWIQKDDNKNSGQTKVQAEPAKVDVQTK